jgi:hypothetical protein
MEANSQPCGLAALIRQKETLVVTNIIQFKNYYQSVHFPEQEL